MTVELDCTMDPCMNGGQCSAVDKTSACQQGQKHCAAFRCDCVEPWSGPVCAEYRRCYDDHTRRCYVTHYSTATSYGDAHQYCTSLSAPAGSVTPSPVFGQVEVK